MRLNGHQIIDFNDRLVCRMCGAILLTSMQFAVRECSGLDPATSPAQCDCDYWHNRHRFHCATRYPPGQTP